MPQVLEDSAPPADRLHEQTRFQPNAESGPRPDPSNDLSIGQERGNHFRPVSNHLRVGRPGLGVKLRASSDAAAGQPSPNPAAHFAGVREGKPVPSHALSTPMSASVPVLD